MHDLLRIAGIASLAALVPLFVALSPDADGNVVVIASPFDPRSAVEIMASAEGSLVSATRFASIVVARSERPGFVARLHGAGAILVLDSRLIGGCF